MESNFVGFLALYEKDDEPDGQVFNVQHATGDNLYYIYTVREGEDEKRYLSYTHANDVSYILKI